MLAAEPAAARRRRSCPKRRRGRRGRRGGGGPRPGWGGRGAAEARAASAALGLELERCRGRVRASRRRAAGPWDARCSRTCRAPCRRARGCWTEPTIRIKIRNRPWRCSRCWSRGVTGGMADAVSACPRRAGLARAPAATRVVADAPRGRPRRTQAEHGAAAPAARTIRGATPTSRVLHRRGRRLRAALPQRRRRPADVARRRRWVCAEPSSRHAAAGRRAGAGAGAEPGRRGSPGARRASRPGYRAASFRAPAAEAELARAGAESDCVATGARSGLFSAVHAIGPAARADVAARAAGARSRGTPSKP